MSLKAELETWAAALKAYDQEEFERSLGLFSRIASSSKILTNIGLIYATLGEHETAIERFVEATNLDQYLAVAYFQRGVSNFLLTRYQMALKDFEEAHLHLRGNQDINYEQLGLKFRLYSAEVLFNKGLAEVYLGRIQEGLADLEQARRDKATEEHNIIDDAIKGQGQGYTVFSIPIGVLYRPSDKKLKNADTKDYMGKAKLVAVSDPGDAFTEFTGSTRLKKGISPTGVYIEFPNATTTVGPNLSRSATVPVTSTTPKTEYVLYPTLERSKTTLNVPSNARELTSRQRQSPPRPTKSPPSRSNSTIKLVIPEPIRGRPVRGLSVKRPIANSSIASAPPQESINRITDFYDDYLDSYGDLDQSSLPPIRSRGGPAAQPDRVAAWAHANVNRNLSIFHSGPRSAPPRGYASSSFGSGGDIIYRKPTRRATGHSSNHVRNYEEEEEGYASGDYEDAFFEIIHVKIHYQDDVRGMTLQPDTPFEEFMGKLAAKFDKDLTGLGLKFKDEDDVKVTLRDDSDYELAVETARASAKGKPEGKLEIWCVDL